MNKIFKTFLAASVSFLAVACNLDQINDTYVPEGSEPSMYQSVYNDKEIEATTTTIGVPVVRSNSKEELTLKLVVTLPEGITVSGTATEVEAAEDEKSTDKVYNTSVTFAAGEAMTNLMLDITNMAIGSTYEGTVSIAEGEPVNENKVIMTTAFSFAKAYTWVSLGEGEWYDSFALESASSMGIQKVEVLKAEGFERYRIINPYANADQLAEAWGAGALGGNQSSVIEFWVLENGSNVAWNGWWYPGLLYEGEGTDIKAYYPSALNPSVAADDAKSKLLMENVFIFYPYWYIDGMGGFGTKYPSVLSLPGGPSIAELLG